MDKGHNIDLEAVNAKRKSKKPTKKRRLERFGLTALALTLLSLEIIDDITGLTTLRGKRGVWDFARKMDMGKYDLSEMIHSLESEKLLVRDGDKLFITPKGRRRAQKLKLQAPTKLPNKWDGKWRVVIFDIPESMRAERNIFRAILKRKGFVKVQNSVFVAPYTNLDELDLVRHEYKIEKYVNFLIAQSANTDNDSLLRKKFSLKPQTKQAESSLKNKIKIWV